MNKRSLAVGTAIRIALLTSGCASVDTATASTPVNHDPHKGWVTAVD